MFFEWPKLFSSSGPTKTTCESAPNFSYLELELLRTSDFAILLKNPVEMQSSWWVTKESAKNSNKTSSLNWH